MLISISIEPDFLTHRAMRIDRLNLEQLFDVDFLQAIGRTNLLKFSGILSSNIAD